ncbi:MAG: redoxin domain-containing protein, partial [Elusimicrobiota bacterium]
MDLGLFFWRLTRPLKALWHRGFEVGDRFPGFSLTDTHGKNHAVPTKMGDSWTMLWFTNLCESCQTKIPLLADLHNKASGKVQILAISLSGNDKALTDKIAAQSPFPVLPDPEDIVASKIGLSHPPQTCPFHNLFILDKDRRIVFRHHLSAMKPEAFRSLWKETGSKSKRAYASAAVVHPKADPE